MNINLFFPKVFTLVRDTFDAANINVNDFYAHRYDIKICILFLVICLLLVLVPDKIIPKKFAVFPGIAAFLALGGIAYFYTIITNDNQAIADVNNGFPVAQTSFQVRPNKIASGKNLHDYLCEMPYTKLSTTNDYQIYARVYADDGTYQTYLFGTMKDGHVTTNMSNPHKAKVATKGMLVTLNSYVTYIKKHHLENDFKNNAELEFSHKYMDQDHQPMLIMEDKNGRVLRIKAHSSTTAKNVILTK